MAASADALTERLRRLARQPAAWLVVTGVILYVGSAWLWYAKVFTAPQSVFEGMLARNLATSAVVIRQQGRGSGVDIDKRSSLTFGHNPATAIKATTTATGSQTDVSTETVATTSREYNRYTAIRTAAGTPAVDSRAVLGKWADGTDGPTAFNQTLLRPYGMPMGQVAPGQQQRLTQYLRDNEVFQTDYAVKHTQVSGRPAYTYQVRIQPVAYVSFLKGYAAAEGLSDLKDVTPGDLAQQPPVEVRLTIDVHSRRLLKAEYPGLGTTESFSDYNVARPIGLPKAQLSAIELRDLVNGLR